MNSSNPQNTNTANVLMAATIALAVSLLLFLWHAGNELAGDYRAVDHSYAMIGKLETLMSHVTDGETGERAIRGQASREETQALLEEGISVLPLPVPKGLKGPLQ